MSYIAYSGMCWVLGAPGQLQFVVVTVATRRGSPDESHSGFRDEKADSFELEPAKHPKAVLFLDNRRPEILVQTGVQTATKLPAISNELS